MFLENKSGHLAECISLLSRNDITINAMLLSDTEKISILQFIADDPDKIVWSLKRNGFGVAESEVLLLHLPDTTQALESLLDRFKQNNIIIEYMYMGKDSQFVFRFDDMKAALKAVYSPEVS